MSLDPKSSYYDAGGIETLELIQAKLTSSQYQGFLLGNVLKYASRMMWKHGSPKRDCEKALMYLTELDSVVEVKEDGEL